MSSNTIQRMERDLGENNSYLEGYKYKCEDYDESYGQSRRGYVVDYDGVSIIENVSGCIPFEDEALLLCGRYIGEGLHAYAVFNADGEQQTAWYKTIKVKKYYENTPNYDTMVMKNKFNPSKDENNNKIGKKRVVIGCYDRYDGRFGGYMITSTAFSDTCHLYGVSDDDWSCKKIFLWELEGKSFRLDDKQPYSNIIRIFSDTNNFFYIIHGNYEILGKGMKFYGVSNGMAPMGYETFLTEPNHPGVVKSTKGVVFCLKTEKIYPDVPAKLCYENNKYHIPGNSYLFADTGKESFVFMFGESLDINGKVTEIYRGSGKILRDEKVAGLFFIEDSSKLYMIADKELVPCDEYRVSGEEKDPRNITTSLLYNNIVYVMNGDSVRMVRFQEDKGFEPVLILDGEFDKVYYINDVINVISKDGKETYVSDECGILFPKNQEARGSVKPNEVIWFDECEPADMDNDQFVVTDGGGKRRNVVPTNKSYS